MSIDRQNWKGRRKFLRNCLTACTAILIVACQPAPEERLARAEAYVNEADYRSAILELKNALQVNPDLGEARLLFAQASYQLGDFATAEFEYERALGLGHDRSEVWVGFGRTLIKQRKAQEALERVLPNLESVGEAELLLKGDILNSLGNTTEASIAYQAALVLNPSSPGALIGQAVVAASRNELQAARNYLDKAIAGNPDSPLVWRAMGNYLRTQRDFIGAAEALAKSMALETKTTPLADRFEARISRATALVEARNFDAATAQLAVLSVEFPRHPELYFVRGRIAFGTGDYDLAQSELQEYLAMVPSDVRGQAVLGAINFSQDNLRQAEMYLMQAVRANFGGESIRRLLAETQLRLDKPAEALAALQAAEAQGQSDAMLLSMLGRAEIGLGDTESAIHYFEQSSAADPANPLVKLSLAASYLQAGRAADAIKVLESMQDVPGNLYRREMLLIGAYLGENRRDDAIEQGDILLRKYSQDSAAHALVGVLHKSIGSNDRAEGHFNQALEFDPDNLGALYNLGVIALSAADMNLAAARFGQLLDSHPAFLPGLASLAAVLQHQNNLAEMRPRLTAAIDVAPNSIAPRVLMARVELASGQPDAALAEINDARELFPDEAGLDYLEGTVLRSKGQIEEALIYFSRAVAASPDNKTYVRDFASTMIEVGDVELANDLPREALLHYEAAAGKDWTRAVAIGIARARQAAGVENTTDSLERWLSDNPTDAGVRRMYAQLLEAKGDTDRAVEEYERLHAVGELDATGMNNLAWQYFLSGRSEAAVLAQQAHELTPDSGSITDTLGWILFNAGETERAVTLLREAVNQSPDNTAIQSHLDLALAKKNDN